MKPFWSSYSRSITQALGSVQVTGASQDAAGWDRGLEILLEWTRSVCDADGTLHFVGNGASANMASHMAVDWTKNARVRAFAYNDVAFLTAIGNDLGYDQVFAGPVEWYGSPRDVLATISSSGNSPSVLKAIDAARRKGCRVVTFSGMEAGNASRRLGDLNVFVPALTYGIVECTHQVLLHSWLDAFMNVHEWDAKVPQKPAG